MDGGFGCNLKIHLPSPDGSERSLQIHRDELIGLIEGVFSSFLGLKEKVHKGTFVSSLIKTY